MRSLASSHPDAISMDDIHDGIEAMVAAARTAPRLARLISEITSADDEDTRHAISVCHLWMLLGLQLRSYLATQRPLLPPSRASDLVPLALGGLMHDIGRLRTPCEENLEHPDPEVESASCLDARRILGKAVPASVVHAAVNHHRWFNGLGFPIQQDLKQPEPDPDEIHVLARIVAVADHFDQRRWKHSEESRLDSLAWMCDAARGNRFDPVVLAALPIAVPASPAGSMVRLSSGTEAMVLHADERDPLRPVIREILRGESGAEIDLRLKKRVRITHHDEFRILPPQEWPPLLRPSFRQAA